MDKKYPISKYSMDTGWIFVKEFTGTYEEALFDQFLHYVTILWFISYLLG